MTYTYQTRGVCSRQIVIELEDGVIQSCRFVGGCNGNTKGICSLVQGMPAEEVIERLEGTDCNGRGTSCPDQLAKALKACLADSL